MQAIVYISGAVAILATILMLTRLNAVHALLYLIVSLLAVAVIFYVFGAAFAAALEVIIYAGAIMVLFVFVIMLLNAPKEVSLVEKEKWLRYLALPFGAGLLLEAAYVLQTLPSVTLPPGRGDRGVGTTWSVGIALFTDYLLPFEVTSVLILMAVVGASISCIPGPPRGPS